MTRPDPTPLDRRLRREWMLLVLALAVVALLLGLERAGARARAAAAERDRLATAVAALESNLVQQLRSIRVALQGVADEAVRPGGVAAIGAKLALLADVMPGVSTLLVTDAQGRVVASDRAELVGMDFASRADVREVLAQPRAGPLQLSPPFGTAPGEVAMNLALAVPGPDGRPMGVAAATLDPAYFTQLLSSEIYARGMSGGVAHGDGTLLLAVPAGVLQPGLQLRQPGSMFQRHVDSGQLATVMEGVVAATGERRFLAQRSVQPPSLQMSDPLVLRLTRPSADVHAGWLQQALLMALLWLLLAAGTALGLRRLQRQDRDAAARGRERERESELESERLQLALAGADLALWDLDLDSGRCTVNRRWFEMIGEPPDGVPADGEAWYQRIHPEDRDAVRERALAHQAGTTPGYEARYRVRHANGEWIWVLDQGRVVERAADGRARRMVGTHMDITAARRAEDALRASEQASRGLLEALLAGVVRHGPDTTVRAANPAACRILGLTLDQMLGRQAMDPGWHFVEPDRTPMAPERYPVQRVLAEGRVLDGYVGGIVHPQRTAPTWVLANAFPVFGDDGAIAEVVVTFVDITELHQAQQRLRLLEAAIERLNDVVIITEAAPLQEPGPRIVFVNPAFERITGWPAAAALGCSPRMLQGPTTDRAELARIGHALAAGEGVHSELVNRHRDGRDYWVELEIVPLRDAAGTLTHFVGVQRDVSARKQAEASLRAAQQDLAATLDAVPDLLFEIDDEGFIRGHRSPRQDLLYTEPDRFLDRRVAEVLPPAATEIVMAALHEALREGHSQGRQYELDMAGGTQRFELSVARKPMPEGQRPRLIVLARDITDRHRAEAERRELERRLAAAQKLESINTLAGGIAHEFNNLVPSILGNVAMALAPEHPAQESLEQIQRAAQRARTMVQQILDFSRSRPPQLAVQPLQPVIDETLALLRSTLPPTVRLQGPAPADGPALALRADATQLQQVLMNLCINAWHALPEAGGRIEVGLEAADTAPLPLPAAAPAGVLHLWVRDDGVGMDEATRRRIFEPFFTTKPVGQGTGLGLAVVHALVASHGGAIEVDSAPGAGTSFHLWFPRARPAAGDTPALAAATGAAVAGSGAGRGRHVVYVDDDEVMRLMVLRLLQRQGWRVTAVDSADAALAAVDAPGADAALLVTDFHMPGTSGLELAARLRERHPALPVVISTGHVTPALDAGARRFGVRALLNKENTLEELAPLLQRVLDDGRP